MKAGAVLAGNKGSVIGNEIVVGECLVNRVAVPLDLDDHSVTLKGKSSLDVNLHRAGRSNANGQGVGGGEFGCFVRVDDSSGGEDPR